MVLLGLRDHKDKKEKLEREETLVHLVKQVMLDVRETLDQ